MTEKSGQNRTIVVLSVLLSAAENVLLTVSYHVGVVVDNFTKLMAMLVKGTKTWIVMALRLLLFTLLLMPGWYRLLKYWFFDPFILRNVEYGKGARLRNLMDVYLPHIQKHAAARTSTADELAPVVIFVSGGAWIIGYKLWSALVARGLATLGMLVVVPDYRNFPQGDIGDMMDDIREATQWTYDHAHRFGGDRRKIVLAGQSAGAHICLSLLVTEYLAKKSLSNRILTDFLEAHPPQSSIYASHDLSYPAQSPPTEAASDDGDDLSQTAAAPAPAPVDEYRGDAAHNNSSFFSDDDDEHGGFSSFDVAPMGRRLQGGLCGSGGSLQRLAAALDGSSDASEAAGSSAQNQQHADDDAPWFSPLVDTSGLHLDAVAGADCALHLDDFDETTAAADASNAASRPPTLRSPAEATIDDSDAPVYAAPRIAVLDKVQLYVGISGPLDLVALASHLHARGLDASILHWICAGDLHRYSPALVLAQYATACASSPREAASCLRDFVPVALFHGSHDRSIPCTVSRRLAQLMQDHAGADRVWYREYDGWTHTDAILEAPLAGSADFFCDLAAAVHRFTSPREKVSAGAVHAQQKVETDDFAHTHHPAGRRGLFQPSVDVPADVPALLPPLAPTWVVQLARFVNPF